MVLPAAAAGAGTLARGVATTAPNVVGFGSKTASRMSRLQAGQHQARTAEQFTQTPSLVPRLPNTQSLEGISARKSALHANQFASSPVHEFSEAQTPSFSIDSLKQRLLTAAQSESMVEESSKDTGAQDLVKSQAKKMIPRAASFLANTLAAALDLGTGGVALVIDVFVYAFTLGWFNLEMIYGRWIKKGKDPVIAPISWSPIPMPIDPNANILQGLVIAADIALALALLIALSISLLLALATFSLPLLISFLGAKSVFELFNLF